MNKIYDGKEVKKQAFIGWLIAAAGFVVQLTLESLIGENNSQSLAVYVIGIPFAVGGLIFSHALFTLLTGKEHHPLDRLDENFADIYQANMIRMRKHFKVCAVIAVIGVSLTVLFFITKIPYFSSGLLIIFLGIFYYVFGLYRWTRCPACLHMATGPDGRSIQMNLHQCAHCGAKLENVIKKPE
ncbi:hypothetical protein Sps_02710 [Shewanella psychrophila]|uniref:Uncharacterized protein n=1 Tax=Shewanella psychrophila TaxID=225848 RepID=A0A1S6HQT3_9GAMM|nr:hypothetical protein [Shewanella psychrophila]AQS37862.1 hypothetical protein Sps_02710 [Shewanella psychrophila]